MADVRFSSRAYCKIMLHAAKYPHCAINGVLLAESPKVKDSKKGKGIIFVDAVPLFHLCLHVSPMAELALMQVDTMATGLGLVVAGYYLGNEILDDLSYDKPCSRIADKIAETYSSACLAIIDNKKVTLGMEEVAVKVLQNVEGKWKSLDPNSFLVEQKGLEAASALLNEQAYDDLIDFDNHLDDISVDWRNIDINQRVTDLTGD